VRDIAKEQVKRAKELDPLLYIKLYVPMNLVRKRFRISCIARIW